MHVKVMKICILFDLSLGVQGYLPLDSSREQIGAMGIHKAQGSDISGGASTRV